VSPRRIGRAAAALLLGLSASACMSIDTNTNQSYTGPAVYSGTRYDLGGMGNALIDFQIPWLMFLVMDLPFSLVADTVLLPFTIPRDSARSEKQTEEMQVSKERPSPATPFKDEPPLDTAKRLFQACEKMVLRLDPHLADCYSIDAQVEVDGGPPLRGGDYKLMLREGIERASFKGETVDWREPEYAVEGERVRIKAMRGSNVEPPRSPMVLVVGPCPDGSWRILEEQSIGWPEPK